MTGCGSKPEILADKRLAIIGAGAMGGGLARALVRHNVMAPERVTATDIDAGKLNKLHAEISVNVTTDNSAAVRNCELVLLAVKPQILPYVLMEIAEHLRADRHLLISIAAGVPIAQLERATPPRVPVVRVMPNTPCLVGAGVCAIALGTHATDEHRQIAHGLFGAVGITMDVEENWMDAVTALSGSGPAYVFVFMEALSDAAVNAGLPRDLATPMAIHTVLGAARMAAEMPKHLAELKEMVTSPGGTTIAALHTFERSGFRGIIMDAIQAAVERARELATGREAD